MDRNSLSTYRMRFQLVYLKLRLYSLSNRQLYLSMYCIFRYSQQDCLQDNYLSKLPQIIQMGSHTLYKSVYCSNSMNKYCSFTYKIHMYQLWYWSKSHLDISFQHNTCWFIISRNIQSHIICRQLSCLYKVSMEIYTRHTPSS